LFEPVWNRNHIASVQITMAENFGVEGRGSFYDGVGALRDVIQNHLFQITALLAMEPPVGGGMEALRDEKERVFRAMDRVTPADLVRGQFEGYRNESGVAPNSDVETFAALRLHIDSWRWAGVPWLLRAGKQLPEHVTEVLVEFNHPPHRVFTEPQLATDGPNYLRFRLSPSPVIAMGVRSLTPSDHLQGAMSELTLCEDVADERLPYERLLGEAMTGDPFMFARQDGVEAAWAVVDGVLDNHEAAHPYPVGSWGPAGADRLLNGAAHWHQPETPSP
jgi:glucose-6-phosphate 1-dehydrogenase